MTKRTWTTGKVAGTLLTAVLLAACGGDRPEALLASAKGYLSKDDRKAALIELRNALQKKADFAEARFLLGKTLLENGDAAGAEKELRRALELGYSADEALPQLANAMLRQGQFKKLTDELGSSAITSPDGKAALQTALGRAELALRHKDAAAAAFAAANAATPEYPPALLGQASLKALAGDLPGALALVDAALIKSPKLAEGWQLKGDILGAQGKQDDALTAYRKSAEVAPNELRGHVAIVSLLLEQGKWADAATQVAAMTRVAPQDPQTLYLKALLAYKQKNLAVARDTIQQQLKTAPDNLPGLLLAGAIEYELKSYPQAEAKLLKVLQAVPNHRFARRTLIATYLRNAQPAKALETLKPVLDRIENDSGMLALAGDVYLHNGQTAEAAHYFEMSAALDPNNSGKRTAAAMFRLATGNTEPGLQELEEIASSDTGIRADLALIAVHLKRRELDKALVAIDALEKKQPDNPIASNLRGEALLAKGDVAGARRNFDRALTLSPTYLPAAANLARLDITDKKPEEAKRRFEGVLAKDPKNVQALLAIAELRARAGGSTEEVAVLIRKAVTADPGAPWPRQVLIAHYLRNKDAKQAIEIAQDALAALPDNPDIVEALGRAQLAARDSNQALATYGRLAKLRPESPIPFVRIAEVHAAALNNDAALESLRKALALKPDLVDVQRQIIGLEISAGRVQRAIAVARDVQKQRPKQSVGYILEGDIRAVRKEWKEAAAAYRMGLKQAGTSDLAVKLYAMLVASGNAGADNFAASWLRDHPKDGGFLHYIAQVAIAKKNYGAAVQHYRVLLEMQPNSVVVLNNLAWLAGKTKDPKAIEYAEKANRLAPNEPGIMDTLGTLLVDRGDTARGLELLQKAAAGAPDSTTVRLNLAKGLIKAGQRDAAKKELDVLARLGDKLPEQPEVTQLLKGL